MVIAVYAEFNDDPALDSNLYFLKSFIENLATANPLHSFHLIISDKLIDEFDEKFARLISLQPPLKLFYQARLNRKVLNKIKDIKADALFSFNHFFKTTVTQSLVINQVKTRDKFDLKDLQKLKAIFVLSNTENSFLQNQLDPEKIKILYGGPSKLFSLLPDTVKQTMKEKYTNGTEYFVYRGAIEKGRNIIPLLKGFSIFKKRQKSTMKLVILGRLTWQDNEFQKLIGSYKYRDDVVIVNNAIPIEEAQIIGAAYAYIQPYSDSFLLYLFDAMQSSIPVLLDNSLPQEIISDAALFFEPTNEADVAEKLMLIYKDELLRSQLIEKGKKIGESYTWEKTISIVGQHMQLSGTV